MNNQESMRDAATCLGGFLGLFLGAMLGFAFGMKFLVDRAVNEDGSVHSNMALMPFLGVMAIACVGAVLGAVVVRVLYNVGARAFSSRGDQN